MPDPLGAIVIGAGPAGLATSRELQRHGVEHVVLERDGIGQSWTRLYDSLTLHTGRHMSGLPGLPFARGTPLFLSRDEFVAYLHRYHAHFRLPLRSGVAVETVRREADHWITGAGAASFRARALVIATGIISNPVTPALPGSDAFTGVMRHSATYRRPSDCAGKRVLVVGCGNSGGEIASELGRAGVDTTISIRSGANVVPLHILGIPIQYLSFGVRHLPRRIQELVLAAVNRLMEWRKGPPVLPRAGVSPLDAIPLIGFHLVDAIREGAVKVRGGIDHLTASGVFFAPGEEEPFDEIIFATGFRAAIGFLAPLVTFDARGFASRSDRVRSADQPDLYFVGHNYDTTGALFNIRLDARRVAAAVAVASHYNGRA